MTNDEYVERATTLDGHKAPSGDRLDGSETLTDYYTRLSVINSLRWNGKWKDRRLETKKTGSAILDAVAGQLELTDYQKEEASRVFGNLPDRFDEGYPTSVVALCVCGHVGVRDGRDYHPNNHPGGAGNTTTFGELASEFGVTYTHLYRCWKSINAVIDL